MLSLLLTFFFFIFSRRWFSIQKNQLVYQKKFKVLFLFNNMLRELHSMTKTNTNDAGYRSGAAHGGGGGPAAVHGQD